MDEFEVNDTLDLLWPQKRIFEHLNLREYLMLCGMLSYKVSSTTRTLMDKELNKLNDLTDGDDIVENANKILRLIYNETKDDYRSALKELGINLHVFYFSAKKEDDDPEEDKDKIQEIAEIRLLKKINEAEKSGDQEDMASEEEDELISVADIKDEARIQLELNETVNLSIRTEEGVVLTDQDEINVKEYGRGTRFIIADRASEQRRNNHCSLL